MGRKEKFPKSKNRKALDAICQKVGIDCLADAFSEYCCKETVQRAAKLGHVENERDYYKNMSQQLENEKRQLLVEKTILEMRVNSLSKANEKKSPFVRAKKQNKN